MREFEFPGPVPRNVKLLQPWKDLDAFKLCEEFYRKYYRDQRKRILILGINPGRFGGGQTGIPFTDPVRLLENCQIHHPLALRPELSSDFIYRVISEFGTPESFYAYFFISSVCPVGFVSMDKNLNYYDLPALEKKVNLFAPGWIEKQLKFGLRTDVCVCLGEGKNFRFLVELNNRYQWFDRVEALSHPRFIMQYKRKQLPSFIRDYVTTLQGMI